MVFMNLGFTACICECHSFCCEFRSVSLVESDCEMNAFLSMFCRKTSRSHSVQQNKKLKESLQSLFKLRECRQHRADIDIDRRVNRQVQRWRALKNVLFPSFGRMSNDLMEFIGRSQSDCSNEGTVRSEIEGDGFITLSVTARCAHRSVLEQEASHWGSFQIFWAMSRAQIGIDGHELALCLRPSELVLAQRQWTTSKETIAETESVRTEGRDATKECRGIFWWSQWGEVSVGAIGLERWHIPSAMVPLSG